MKIIVEIDGKRHRLVHGRDMTSPCYRCSLERVCGRYIGSPCLSGGDYFKLEKEKYADEHPKSLWKDACSTDLPEIDREVIALLTNGKVVFAHRPPERWYGRNMDGEESVFHPKTYDEGEWNQPDVKWWLDIELPKMEE